MSVNWIGLFFMLGGIGLFIYFFVKMNKYYKTGEKEKENEMFKYGLISLFVGIVLSYFAVLVSGGEIGSDWDNLSESEKKWYRENHGNGIDYDSIIDDYRK